MKTLALAAALALGLSGCATTPAQLAAQQAMLMQMQANINALNANVAGAAIAAAQNAAALNKANAQIIAALGPINCGAIPLINAVSGDLIKKQKVQDVLAKGNATAATLCAAAGAVPAN